MVLCIIRILSEQGLPNVATCQPYHSYTRISCVTADSELTDLL